MKNKFFITLFACLLPWMAGAQQIISKQNNVAEKDYIAYLFTYFTGNHISEEAVCYAVSTDGYTYWALNDNKSVIDSKIISSTGGVRDPHILRCEDGKTFYMVVTDMVSDNGWDSNRAMVLLKSTDLVNWTSSIVNMQKRYAGQEKLKRVWAPQTIFDPEAGKYMVYWSMKYGDGADVILPMPTKISPIWKESRNLFLLPRIRNRASMAISSLKTESSICFIKPKGTETGSR